MSLRGFFAAGFGCAIVFLSLAPLSGQQAGKGKPVPWSPEMMVQLKQVGGVQAAPDGKRVAYTVRQPIMDGDKSEYLTHIHLANADGSESLPLTQGDKSCDSPQWAPDGKLIAFLSARGGKRDLWLIRPTAGEARRLTQVKTGVGSFKWAPDGKSIAFTALEPPTLAEERAAREKTDARVLDDNIKMSRLYVVAVDEAARTMSEPKLLTKGNYSVNGGAGRSGYDWSPDSKLIVFCHTRSAKADDWTTADLSVVEAATGSVKLLVQTPAAEFAPLWSPDGTTIAYIASDNPPTWGGNGLVQVVPAQGGSSRSLAESFDRFGRYSELVGWSADSKRLYYTEARGTTVKLNALPLAGGPEVITQTDGMIPGGVHLNQSRTTVAFAWETSERPAEAHTSPAPKWAPVRVSQVHKDLPESPLGRTEIIRWKSTDQQEIEGLLTYPVGYEKGKKYPLLLVIHGGPAGVFTQSFIGSPYPYPLAACAAHGYALLRPNPRGSSGYGQKFRYANYGDWGKGDYQDLMTGVDHLIGLGVADGDKLGVMGWSYGGYMTSWVVTHSKRFKAASMGAGVCNLVSMTGTSDIASFLPDYFSGELWDRHDVYRAHSAIFHVKGVATPTLIQHGERDDRVPLAQGLEFYNALKRQNCPVKMVVYPRSPHGIEEPKLLLDAMTRNLQWFEQYVR